MSDMQSAWEVRWKAVNMENGFVFLRVLYFMPLQVLLEKLELHKKQHRMTPSQASSFDSASLVLLV